MKNTISGLLRRRRELTGDMLELLVKVDALAADVEALDRTLRLFDPDIAVETVPALQQRPKADWARRGQVARKVFEILRSAEKPLSTAEVAFEVHGNDASSLHVKRVRKCLDAQRTRGTIKGLYSDSGLLLWELA